MKGSAVPLFVLSLVAAACAPASQPNSPTALPTSPPTAPPTAAQFTPATSPAASQSATAVLATIRTAEGPIGLAATGDTIWVENHRANFVSRIDPGQNLETEQLTDVNVHCAIAAGAGFVWTAQAAANNVNKVDATTGKVVSSIDLPQACGVAADANDLWVTSPETGKLMRYDPVTLAERAAIALEPMIFGVAIGPEALWVVGEADGGTVYRADAATNQLTASIKVALGTSTGIAVGYGAVWVPSRDNKVIYRIDPATNTVVTTIQMPIGPGGIGVGPDAIWASGFGDGKVYRIDPTTNAITGTVSTGGRAGTLGPPLFAFDSIWVAGLDKNCVFRIDPAAIP